MNKKYIIIAAVAVVAIVWWKKKKAVKSVAVVIQPGQPGYAEAKAAANIITAS